MVATKARVAAPLASGATATAARSAAAIGWWRAAVEKLPSGRDEAAALMSSLAVEAGGWQMWQKWRSSAALTGW